MTLKTAADVKTTNGHPHPQQTNTENRTTFIPHAPDVGYDGYGKAMSDCGDAIEYLLTLKNDRISKVACKAHGCDNTKIAAKAAGLLIKSQSLKEAFLRCNPETIDSIAKLPPPNKHCADLAAQAMQQALQSAATSGRESWRRLYRRD